MPEDARYINQYWTDNTDEDLKRLGEVARPDPQGNIDFLKQFCQECLPPECADEGILIWMMDNSPIGYCSLREIHYGSDAQIHLHMWEKSQRRKGVGGVFFCLSAQKFIRDFQLKTLYCQPKFDNPMPNGMLKKIGFALLGQVDWKHPGNGSIVQQNRYLISEDTIQKYLDARKHDFSF